MGMANCNNEKINHGCSFSSLTLFTQREERGEGERERERRVGGSMDYNIDKKHRT